MITLITPLLFAAALFLPSLAHGADPSANLSVQVVPPGSGPTLPPQAAAQGFTTLALNADFSQGIDIDCEGAGKETQEHQWYTGMQGVVASDCGTGLNPATNPNGPIMWPFKDPVTGDTVVNIRRTTTPSTSTYQGNMGGVLGRVGITTKSFFYNHGTSYPINLYVECVERIWPVDVMGMWSNCWGGGNAQNLEEIDLNEIHSSGSQDYGNPNALWWKWDQCGGCAEGPGVRIITAEPNWRPDDRYHKYGILVYQTSATNVRFCGYIDDIQVGCHDVAATEAELSHGTSWLLSMTTGNPCCGEGAWAFVDAPITGVGFANGTTYVDVGGVFAINSCCLQKDYGVRVSGTGTSADGYWSWNQDGTRIYLYGNGGTNQRSTGTNQSPCCGGGSPVPLTGTWSGGGTFNLPGAGTGGGRGHDHAFNHSVKSFRIWTCADWRTTQCSQFNNNNPYK